MSSLQCPARVLVARHGEAEYETDLCSDDGGSLTAAGSRAGARARRVAARRAGRAGLDAARCRARCRPPRSSRRRSASTWWSARGCGSTAWARWPAPRRRARATSSAVFRRLGRGRRRRRDRGRRAHRRRRRPGDGGARGGRRRAPRRGGRWWSATAARSWPRCPQLVGLPARARRAGVTLPNCGVIEPRGRRRRLAAHQLGRLSPGSAGRPRGRGRAGAERLARRAGVDLLGQRDRHVASKTPACSVRTATSVTNAPARADRLSQPPIRSASVTRAVSPAPRRTSPARRDRSGPT